MTAEIGLCVVPVYFAKVALPMLSWVGEFPTSLSNLVKDKILAFALSLFSELDEGSASDCRAGVGRQKQEEREGLQTPPL